MQLPPLAQGEPFEPFEERKITLLMVAGGHFAGMVVSLRPLNLAQGKGLKPERQEVKGAGEVRVLKHKTFHRYTSEFEDFPRDEALTHGDSEEEARWIAKLER
jgi:hypothetical protein